MMMRFFVDCSCFSEERKFLSSLLGRQILVNGICQVLKFLYYWQNPAWFKICNNFTWTLFLCSILSLITSHCITILCDIQQHCFPSQSKRNGKPRKNSKYVTALRQSWRKPFRNKLVTFNYSRSFKIKSIILVCSEVINTYLLRAHEKKELLDLASKDRGLGMSWSMRWGWLMKVQKKHQLYNWWSPYSDRWDKLFCWQKRSLGQKGLTQTYFIMIFHFQLCQPLDKLNSLCAVIK